MSLSPDAKRFVSALLFIIPAGVACHLLYGWIGFYPTDEGYMLFGSRRILDGLIPHRDYITIRPPGTHYLHAHLLLWAGSRLIWWSRLLASLQIALTTWCWILLFEHHQASFPGRNLRFVVALIAFFCSIGTNMLTPWNTVDGLMFISAGLLILATAPRRRLFAFFLIGLSPLFRQNFALLLPLIMIATGSLLSAAAWLAVGLPSLLFVLFLFATSAWSDALVQLSSHGGSLLPALLAPISTFRIPILQGFLIGAAGSALLSRPSSLSRRWGLCLLHFGLFYSVLILGCARFDAITGWFLFFFLLPLLPWCLQHERRLFQPTVLALVVAWSVSISEGGPHPQFSNHALFIAAAALLHAMEKKRDPACWLFRRAIVLCLLSGIIAFHATRYWGITGSAPALRPDHELSDAMPDGRGIYANKRIHDYLKELNGITGALGKEGRTYAVALDATQFWVLNPQSNPLCSGWPVDEDFKGPQLKARILENIDALSGRTTFLIQKYRHLDLQTMRPLLPGQSFVVDKVRREWRKTGETEYWEVYE